MAEANPTSGEVCRLLVIGSNKSRLSRIFSSLVIPQQTSLHFAKRFNVHIEYLPCVAKFSSYMNESNAKVRYLESVVYFTYDSNGTLATNPSSLLPYFDRDEEQNNRRFPLIAGVAVGSGIEGPDDTAHINKFIKTMLSGNTEPTSPKIKTIEPNPGYDSMMDELDVYKQLSQIEKDEVNRLQTMGPEKMVKFVVDFTIELIQNLYDGPTYHPKEGLSDSNNHDEQGQELPKPIVNIPHVIDPSNDRYFCRMCRMALFGQDDLQDPPHEVSQHQFSYRKVQHGTMTAATESITDRCQSYFLQQGIQWMGEDIQNGISEGKFNCPNCSAKIGTWIWSGTQCSCGTWVVPAIQIPKSKVDVVKPNC